MANRDKQTGTETPAARMRSRYAAGDFQAARTAAWAVLHDANATEADRAEAERLRGNTEVDPRSWIVVAVALAIAAIVVVVFLL